MKHIACWFSWLKIGRSRINSLNPMPHCSKIKSHHPIWSRSWSWRSPMCLRWRLIWLQRRWPRQQRYLLKDNAVNSVSLTIFQNQIFYLSLLNVMNQSESLDASHPDNKQLLERSPAKIGDWLKDLISIERSQGEAEHRIKRILRPLLRNSTVTWSAESVPNHVGEDKYSPKSLYPLYQHQET